MCSTTLSLAIGAALVAAAPASALASLDPTYSSDGIHSSFENDTYPHVGHAVAIQPDGKIVTAGYTNYGSLDRLHVTRYNLDGSLDTAFGGGYGNASWTISGRDARATDVAIQPDGKIVVVGNLYPDTFNDFGIFVARLTSSGALDQSFGVQGISYFYNPFYKDCYASGVAIDNSGKIVVSGWENSSLQASPEANDGSRALVLRYDSDGDLDTSFYDDGIWDYYDNDDNLFDMLEASQALGVEIRNGNEIVVATHEFFNLLGPHVRLNFYQLTGDADDDRQHVVYISEILDPEVFDFNGRHAYIADLSVSGDEITVAVKYPGGLPFYPTDAIRLTRFDVSPLDLISSSTKWSDTGIEARGMAVLPDGKVIVGAKVDGSDNMELIRYNSDGTVDTDFGTSGCLSIAFSGGDATLHGLAVHSDGRVVGVGTRDGQGLATFRLQGEGIAIGKKLVFRSHHGTYLQLVYVPTIINELFASSSPVNSLTRFTLTDGYGNTNFDQIRFGDVISLQAYHGMYVVAESNGKVNVNRTSVSSWERWQLVNPSNTNDTGPVTCGATIALRSYHNKYLTAEDDNEIIADRTTIGSWERWVVECH